MAALTSARSGLWGTGSTWSGGVAPVDGDTVTILSGHEVEMNSVSTIGSDTSTAAITINANGKLFYPANSSYSPALTLKGDLIVNGTLEIGTQSAPIPANRFCAFYFSSNILGDGKYGVKINAGATVNIYGPYRTPWVYLAADASTANNSLTIDQVPTGWNNGDGIAIAPTDRTYSQVTRRNLTATVTGTSTSLDGLCQYNHKGTGLVRAEVALLNRNIKIAGQSSQTAYVVIDTTAVVRIENAGFGWLGVNTTDKYGIVIKTTTGSLVIRNCAIWDSKWQGFVTSGAAWNNVTLDGNVHVGAVANYNGVNAIGTTSGTIWSVTNNLVIGSTGSSAGGWVFADMGGVISGNRAVGCNGAGFGFTETNLPVRPTVSNLYAHSNASYGFNIQYKNYTLDGCLAFRNNGSGFLLSGGGSNTVGGITLKNCDALTNNGQNYEINGTSILMTGCKGHSEFGYTVGTNLQFAQQCGIVTIEGFDAAAGNGRTACTNDIVMYGMMAGSMPQVTFLSSNIRSTVSFSPYSAAYCDIETYVALHDINGVVGNHLLVIPGGSITPDSTTFRTEAPCSKMVPNSAVTPLRSSFRQIPIAAGNQVTVEAYLKLSGYTGSAPRLMIRRNYSAGIFADVQIDSGLGAADAGGWQRIGGVTPAPAENTVLEVFLLVDTGGTVYVDDWGIV